MQHTAAMLAILGLTAVAAVDVQYVFGSAWPTCKDFGASDFPRLVEDFGSKASFEVVPAVLGTMCADELDCAYESATLCAFDLGGDAAAAATGAGTTAASFTFLECMDSAGKFPLFYDPTPVQACASKQGLDYTKLSKCANGTKADALLKAAQKTVTAACGKEANLPTVLVGGRKVCESDKCTYAAVAAALKGLEETASVAPAPALSLRGASNNATAVGGEPAITYFFASQWPACKAFGSGDFQKVFTDFSGAANITLVPAVRDPKGACVDEKDCAFERATVCAFDGQPVATRAAFLDCLDTPWSDLLTQKKVRKCVKATAGIDQAAVDACVGGARGDELLQQASATWTRAFPQPVNLPQAQVAGETVDASYDAIKKAACKAGSSASVC